MDSQKILANCSCPQARKAQLCKHIWAALLKTEQSYPDFLEQKTEVEIAGTAKTPLLNTTLGSFNVNRPSFEKRPPMDAQLEAQKAYKEKQNDYRKLQYQKQKLRLKTQKLANKNSASELEKFISPKPVQTALDFFSKNGFELSEAIDSAMINLAKKKLSRVFHPDAGGTHEEILELNKNCDVLLNFLKAKKS